MSRMGALGLLALLPALLVGAERLEAQQTVEELQQRLDSLLPLLDQAAEAQRMAEVERRRAMAERAEAVGDLDTIQVGPATVIVPRVQAETARDVFSTVWDAHYSSVGHSPGVERTTFTFRWGGDRGRRGLGVPLDGYFQRVEMPRWIPSARVEESVRSAIALAMNRYLAERQPEVGAWVHGDPLARHRTDRIYRQLATNRSTVARACFEGDAAACVSALGLAPGGTPIEELYTPGERRSLVESWPELARLRTTTGQWEACVRRSDYAACDELLEVQADPTRPLTPAARASLLGYALQRGGPGAWDRMRDGPAATPTETLVAVSGQELEPLVEEWHAWIMDERPESYAGLLPKSAMALVWTLVFAGFAARSTRWRLG